MCSRQLQHTRGKTVSDNENQKKARTPADTAVRVTIGVDRDTRTIVLKMSRKSSILDITVEEAGILIDALKTAAQVLSEKTKPSEAKS